MAQEIMTAKQAADFLQTSRDTLLRLARSRRIPAAKLGREWRFRRTELDKWLAQGGEAYEAAVEAEMDRELAERMADPAHEQTRPLEEVLGELNL